ALEVGDSILSADQRDSFRVAGNAIHECARIRARCALFNQHVSMLSDHEAVLLMPQMHSVKEAALRVGPLAEGLMCFNNMQRADIASHLLSIHHDLNPSISAFLEKRQQIARTRLDLTRVLLGLGRVALTSEDAVTQWKKAVTYIASTLDTLVDQGRVVGGREGEKQRERTRQKARARWGQAWQTQLLKVFLIRWQRDMPNALSVQLVTDSSPSSNSDVVSSKGVKVSIVADRDGFALSPSPAAVRSIYTSRLDAYLALPTAIGFGSVYPSVPLDGTIQAMTEVLLPQVPVLLATVNQTLSAATAVCKHLTLACPLSFVDVPISAQGGRDGGWAALQPTLERYHAMRQVSGISNVLSSLSLPVPADGETYLSSSRVNMVS
ncbi:hypothetical protein KIPB_009693, partial [Kipferlia bialata]